MAVVGAAAAAENRQVIALPSAAHAVWLDDPVTTFDSIRHFLRGEWPLGAVKVK